MPKYCNIPILVYMGISVILVLTACIVDGPAAFPMLEFTSPKGLTDTYEIGLDSSGCKITIRAGGEFLYISKDSLVYILDIAPSIESISDTVKYQVNYKGLRVWFEDVEMSVHSYKGPEFKDTLGPNTNRFDYTLKCVPVISPERMKKITPKCGADITIKFDNFLYHNGVPLKIDVIYAKEKYAYLYLDEIALIEN